jgi:hypothetical protein
VSRRAARRWLVEDIFTPVWIVVCAAILLYLKPSEPYSCSIVVEGASVFVSLPNSFDGKYLGWTFLLAFVNFFLVNIGRHFANQKIG